MARTLQPELIATIFFGVLMALFAVVALAQVAYYAAGRPGKLAPKSVFLTEN